MEQGLQTGTGTGPAEARGGAGGRAPAFVRTRRAGGMVAGEFALPENASAARYLEGLGRVGEAAGGRPSAAREGVPVGAPAPQAPGAGAPFLSVVVRTQGKRLEELAEVLLCLMAQDDDDFEVLVVGHRVDPADEAGLRQVLGSFPPSLAARMRYIPVDGGTRTEPLRVGFASARGRYVSALDDDDLVMDTWVSAFKGLAAEHDGMILHAYSATQKWRLADAPGDGGPRVPCSTSWFDPLYCHPFDAARQLSVNGCPFMSLAFPRYLFEDLGLDFDASLTTTEDWDLLMRAYSVCGVADAPEVTSVYRLWANTDTSHALHTQREWDRNYKAIVDKLDTAPFLFGEGAVEDFRAKDAAASVSRGTLLQTSRLLALDEPLDRAGAWLETVMAHQGPLPGRKPPKAVGLAARPGGDGCDIVFEVADPRPVGMLVFTPTAEAARVLGEFSMRVVDADGAERTLDFSNCSSTDGFQVDCNHIVFLMENPFVAFELPGRPRVARVEMTLSLMSSVPDYYVAQVVRGRFGLMAGRARRWLARKLHGRS